MLIYSSRVLETLKSFFWLILIFEQLVYWSFRFWPTILIESFGKKKIHRFLAGKAFRVPFCPILYNKLNQLLHKKVETIIEKWFYKYYSYLPSVPRPPWGLVGMNGRRIINFGENIKRIKKTWARPAKLLTSSQARKLESYNWKMPCSSQIITKNTQSPWGPINWNMFFIKKIWWWILLKSHLI